jgi:serine/threonine protein kinase
MTSKTSGSITTSQSTTGTLSSMGSSFMASTGSTSGGFDEGAKFPDGQILEAPNLRTFTFMELKTATKNFRPDSVLGEGGFGRVYKGWVDEKTMAPTRNGTGMVVAVKKLNSESMQGYEEWQVKSSLLFLSFYIFYYIKQQG